MSAGGIAEMRSTAAELRTGAGFSSFAAFLINTEAGGVFIIKVKLLSANAVITTGIGKPGSID